MEKKTIVTIHYFQYHSFISDICENLKDFEFIKCATTNYYAHQAARQGNLNLLKYLSKKGVNLKAKDRNENTPILLAALNGHYPIVKYLYSIGAGYIPTKVEWDPFLRVL